MKQEEIEVLNQFILVKVIKVNVIEWMFLMFYNIGKLEVGVFLVGFNFKIKCFIMILFVLSIQGDFVFIKS